MYIKERNEFLLEKYENDILESLNEGKFYISDKLHDLLDDVAEDDIRYDDIHKLFLRLSGEDVDTSMSYLDIGDDNNTIKFINPAKGDKLRDDDKIKMTYKGTRRLPFYKSGSDEEKISKNSVRIGRLLRKVIAIYKKAVDAGKIEPSRYRDPNDIDFSDAEIEKFVNLYKAKFDFNNNIMDRFELVSGEAIIDAYNCENYWSDDMGELGSSCMSAKHKGRYLRLYSESPSVSCLVLRSEDGKVMGRAIVWHLYRVSSQQDSETFMDRIYCARDSDYKLFKTYAKQQKWIYKKDQDMEEGGPFMTPENDYDDDVFLDFQVEVTRLDVGSYLPYCDTMKYYFWKDGIVSNDENGRGPYVKMESTGGDHECYDCDGEGKEECDECYGNGKNDCYDCDGWGHIDCEECDGRGEKECGECYGEGEVDCPECDGSGEDDDGESCGHCGGDQRVSCEECDGDGEIECGECDGDGKEECRECDGEGDIECEECEGEGGKECERCGNFAGN